MGREGHRFEVLPQEVLKRYRAELVNIEHLAIRQRKFSIRLIYVSSNALKAAYLVDLGMFRLAINILNIQGLVFGKGESETIGRGSFGAVVVKDVAGTKFVAKIIKRTRGTPDELK